MVNLKSMITGVTEDLVGHKVLDVRCEECGYEYLAEEMHHDKLCQDCYHPDCEWCEDTIEDEDDIRNIGDDKICISCWENHDYEV